MSSLKLNTFSSSIRLDLPRRISAQTSEMNRLSEAIAILFDYFGVNQTKLFVSQQKIVRPFPFFIFIEAPDYHEKQECATCCRCEGRLMVRRVELDTVQGFEIHYMTTYSNEAALRRLWREDVEEALVWTVVTWSREKP